ncbi:alpha-glucan family phosphorylase [Candidatus Falkowbacteria bacterium HGW-Falkowbacteria-1]|uniref:Alpha-glucan family phosphorylase n=1 Tax=Candidatus Falkowbacteria bacterium HGW-Falkowbacteria-1 TaxID=2013768 RepID=A0A2N2E934_9BACT|nr:MAG: alpha-glucan family phosphorylase [Candidatus Falkowbacteria bacterium HGW-Falkowbacteria-1]
MKNLSSKKGKYKVAYFSMEIALENGIKTYAGGLGVLAGDTLRSAADLGLPMLGVTLLNNLGYFKQKINDKGDQEELVSNYDFSKLKKLPNQVKVKIGRDDVSVGVWEYLIQGQGEYLVPVYLLDTNILGNLPKYSSLTGQLYGPGKDYRLMQEIILGRAGIKILQSLKHRYIKKFHINEGHGSLAAIELFLNSKEKNTADKLDEVRRKCVFTTHTPVFAGHDVFPLEFILEYQKDFPYKLKSLVDKDKKVNMTKIGLYFSNFINGVALSHQKVSNKMFPNYPIHAITNGVHSETWTSPAFAKIYDKYIPNWRNSNLSLRNAFNIPLSTIWQAHQKSKKALLDYIYKKQKVRLEQNVFTIGFARRFTGYKRSNLLFQDIKKLLHIHKNVGEIQIIYAGKAHPNDDDGKNLIKEIFRIKDKYKSEIKIVFLEGYEMKLAKLMISGVDVWLNTPLPPNEASGTSGMKAAHNGVPHFSTLDGWWIEGYIKDKTGWAIGKKRNGTNLIELNKKDAESLYYNLEKNILPRYYGNPRKWQETMQHTIAINASFFNTERMLQQYIQENYFVSET